MSTVHNFFGFVLIAGVLAHAYLGTVANPGTWRVLVDGYVTEEWAKHHHPFWYHQVVKDGPEDEKDEEEGTESDQPEGDDDEKRE
jgi:cytochrome b subunit of formate dehydrogenase